MGGTVTVVIRESDGTEYRMQRWTNSLPWGICNAKMINEDRDHLDAYLYQWQEMKDDWDRNHITGNFEFAMTEVYLPSVGFAPQSYGFVLLDFKTKHLLSLQGYTGLDSVHAISIALELNSYKDPDEETDAARLSDLIKDGHVTTFENRMIDSTKRPLPSWMIENPSVENIAKFVSDKSNKYCTFQVDWSPFTVIDYEFNKEGLDIRHAYAKVKELGFLLNPTEEEIWAEWIKEAELNSNE